VLSKPEKPTIARYFCKNYGRIEELVCDHYETVLEGAMEPARKTLAFVESEVRNSSM